MAHHRRIDGWYNRICQVNGCLPWRYIGATRRIRLNLCILQPTRVHNPNGKSTGSAVLHSSRQKLPILYNGCPYPPELPRSIGLSGLHLTRDAFGQCEPTTQTAPRSVQPCLHRLPQRVPILYNGSSVSPSKLPLPIWGSGSLGTPSPERKRQLDRFSRFCRAQCNRLTKWQTNRQTTLLGR